jgi:hypothetical protein
MEHFQLLSKVGVGSAGAGFGVEGMTGKGSPGSLVPMKNFYWEQGCG